MQRTGFVATHARRRTEMFARVLVFTVTRLEHAVLIST